MVQIVYINFRYESYYSRISNRAGAPAQSTRAEVAVYPAGADRSPVPGAVTPILRLPVSKLQVARCVASPLREAESDCIQYD